MEFKKEKKHKQIKLPNLSNLTPQEIAKVMLSTPSIKKQSKKKKKK